MTTRTLALFDLDETLIAGDSDYEWGLHLINLGVVDRATYEARNQEFYDRYRAGTLVLQDFLDFQLYPLSQFPRAQLDQWHAAFMASRILPMIRPGARALLERHRDAERVIVTATNRFVTAPIAAALGITNLLATELELSFILLNLSRGEGQFFSNRQARSAEELRKLSRAGYAIPILFPPVTFRGEVYVDGGFAWNVPLLQAVEMGATGGGCVGIAPVPLKTITLRLDHPFLFILRDVETGAVLFMGRVVDPSVGR
jgi:predicted acylesterase/phospholipase RssA